MSEQKKLGKKTREIYNPEIKQKFIEETFDKEHTVNVAKTIFKAISPYEEKWEADFCTKKFDELKPALNEILGMRVSSKWMSVSVLQKYSDWYMANGYPNAVSAIEYFDVDRSGHEKIRKQMVANPIQLKKYLDDVYPLKEDKTIDITYRCYLWMAYMGIPEADALKIQNGDVDFNTMKIKFGSSENKKEAMIYSESLMDFRDAVSLAEFMYEHKNYKVPRNRVPGDTILRGIKGTSEVNWRTIRAEVSRTLSEAVKPGTLDKPNPKKRTELALSFYRIWISGLFYRMYERERAGEGVDFLKAAEDDMTKTRVSQDGKLHTSRIKIEGRDSMTQRINRKVRDYKEDYNRWKFVFGI